ncbi:TRAP transporter substrate-binding protein [Hydrogenophaga sp.]|jgi:TRAP-type C4-dicarboxylate transport system substrate-binding protein|uniref:TRAP transporter substrate-binding protein n=1 Tax=Hydrogenophaga sp. TaxID=1904254 RepID=UPI003F6EE857
MRIQRPKTLLAAALLACASIASAQQAPAKTLKLSFFPPATHPMVPALEAWGKSLQQASGGTITTQLYTSEQLGRAVDHYDMVKDGIAEMVMAGPGFSPGRFPIITLVELPFSVPAKAVGTGAFHRWYQKYAGVEMADVKLCMAILHDPGTLHNSAREVKTPADVKGLKLRPPNGTMANYVVSMGATTLRASIGEVRELVDRGVMNSILWPWHTLFLTKAEDKIIYHLDADMYTASNVFAINKRFYDGLSATQKQAVDSHCTPEWSGKIETAWAAWEREGRTKVAAMPNHKIHKMTDAERAQWLKAAEPQAEKLYEGVKRFQLDGATLMGELRQELAK